VQDFGTAAPAEAGDAEATTVAEEGGEGRRRGRDRPRRERATTEVEAAAPPPLPAVHAVETPPVPSVAETRPVAAAPALPPVEAYALPMDALQQLAEASGLQWVNSDADKIRAAQEAIAGEAQTIHVPRERKPMQRIDEGPLVLVETRTDLATLKLPFEQEEAATH